MSRRFIVTLITLLTIGIGASVAIFLAKGYTFSPKEGQIIGTGIISIKSTPDAASVFVDGHLTTATDATISGLSPKQYTIKVAKEGFIPWEKKVEVKEGLVTALKVTLFPSLPTIYPLSFTGVINPTLSPDGTKLAYIVPKGKKAGVWVWTLIPDRPIAFARSAQPHQIAQSSLIDYSQSKLSWSADSKQILATVSQNNYLLEDDGLNKDPRDITPILPATLRAWQEDIEAKERARILSIKDGRTRKIASDSAVVRWSPDETKFLYREQPIKPGEKEIANFKVFDLKEGRSFDIPKALLHFWLPTSHHVVLVEENQISILEYDGTNKAIIYAGNFENTQVFAWPDASRMVVVSSFPTPTAQEPNLYGINLK